MNILSLFDGMSCGQIALNRLGIKYDKYYASEIDKYSIAVTMANYPNTIQLGDVRYVKASDLPKIDLMMGGSPCQSFSFAGKRKGMSTKDEQEILTLEHYLELKSQEYEFEGQSYLFWEYMRLLNEVKPEYFLLENVLMTDKWERILTRAIGVNPIKINSNLVSAQNRERLYWTNIGLQPSGLFGELSSTLKEPKDKKILIKDILQDKPNDIYYLNDNQVERVLQKTGVNPTAISESSILDVYNKIKKDGKSICLTDPCHGSLRLVEVVGLREVRSKEAKVIRKENRKLGVDYNPYRKKDIIERTDGKVGTLLGSLTNDNLIKIIEPRKFRIRRLTPLECERLQTVPEEYTDHVSNTQRYKMLGNGWTIDVIAHILKEIIK
jgi:DNA (cytosine-5)-methyltransferase 3A